MEIVLNDYWQGLKQGCLDLLCKQQIRPHKHQYYTHTIELLAEFTTQQGIDEYSLEVGYAFFEAEKAKPCISQASLGRCSTPPSLKHELDCKYFGARQGEADDAYWRLSASITVVNPRQIQYTSTW